MMIAIKKEKKSNKAIKFKNKKKKRKKNQTAAIRKMSILITFEKILLKCENCLKVLYHSHLMIINHFMIFIGFI